MVMISLLTVVAVGFGVVAGPGRHERSCQIVMSNVKESQIMINNNKTNNDLQYQSKKQDFLHQKNVKAKTTFSLTFEFPVADCFHLGALVG